jgi:hypothetical protein
MDVQETVNPPKLRRKFGVRSFLILLFVVLIGWCAVMSVGFYMTQTWNLSGGCAYATNYNTPKERCDAWARKVLRVAPGNYFECLDFRPEDSGIYDEVYFCLDRKGLGVDDLE